MAAIAGLASVDLEDERGRVLRDHCGSPLAMAERTLRSRQNEARGPAGHADGAISAGGPVDQLQLGGGGGDSIGISRWGVGMAGQ
jgi:hypothetical protein